MVKLKELYYSGDKLELLTSPESIGRPLVAIVVKDGYTCFVEYGWDLPEATKNFFHVYKGEIDMDAIEPVSFGDVRVVWAVVTRCYQSWMSIDAEYGDDKRLIRAKSEVEARRKIEEQK